MREALTEACRAALKWLRQRNGTGVFDRDGVLLAAGGLAPFMRSTWNTLVARGLIVRDGRRLTLTALGQDYDCGLTSVRTPVEANPEGTARGSRWIAPDGRLE